MYEIEHGVPLQPKMQPNSLEGRYPFLELRFPDDMFRIPAGDRQPKNIQDNITEAVKTLRERGSLPKDYRVSTRIIRTGDGVFVGVWRKFANGNGSQLQPAPDPEPEPDKFHAGDTQPIGHPWKASANSNEPRIVSGYALNCGDLVKQWAVHAKFAQLPLLAKQVGIEPSQLFEYLDSKPIPEEVMRRIIIAVHAIDFDTFKAGVK